jgi:hypothetical protein
MRIQLAKYVITTRTDDGMVLLDQRSGRCWQVNESGALALGKLLDGAAAEEAAQALEAEYEVTAERARDDVLALVTALQAGRLVVSS